MDLVNSVTQNSNNRKTTMENGPNDDEDDSKRANGKGEFQAGAPNGNELKDSKQQHSSADGKQDKVPDYLRAIGMDPRKFWPKKYRFTREKSPGQHNPLTIAQRNFYESNGYIVIDDCIPKRLMDQIKMSKPSNLGQPQSMYREKDLVEEFLLDKLLMKNGRLTQYVKCFCDEKSMLMTHRLIENFQTNDMNRDLIDNGQQWNGRSSIIQNNNNRQTLFRDWIYLPFRPIDKVVGTIVALEPIEHVILVVPGTHRVGQCTISSTLDNISAAYDSSQEKRNDSMISREIYESSPEKLSTLVDKSKKGFKYINLKQGQTLFYHPGLVHGFSFDLVNFNKRQTATLAYYAAADCEFVDLRRAQKSFEEQASDGKESNGVQNIREQVPISLAHFGDMDPSDYRSWLDKPRLVGDPRANL